MAPQCILLVDDQRDIVRLLHSALQTLGHELDIIDAPSGEEALLEASRRKIDLLVADYRLPGISGVEMMRKVRARNADLKVIFISGVTLRKAREEMLGAGAVAIFDKPIPMAIFWIPSSAAWGWCVRSSHRNRAGRRSSIARRFLNYWAAFGRRSVPMLFS
jgi:CheY-like chemotaxis protein